MRIGIDIDDTLTDVKDELYEACKKYAKSLGKKLPKDINIEDKYNNGSKWQELFHFNYKELKYFLKDIQEGITNKAIPRDNAVDVINKLKNDGHEIIIITARDSEFHDDPYMYSKKWLDKNNIYYDKLVVNARDKKKICIEENIDFLIDDNESNCLSVASAGINTIRISNYLDSKSGIACCNNWNEIYEYIKNNFK